MVKALFDERARARMLTFQLCNDADNTQTAEIKIMQKMLERRVEDTGGSEESESSELCGFCLAAVVLLSHGASHMRRQLHRPRLLRPRPQGS